MALAETIAAEIRKADARDAAALQRIIELHVGMSRRLQPYQTALVNRVLAESKDAPMTRAAVERLPEYRALIAEFEQEMADYSAALVAELKQDSEGSAALGIASALVVLAAIVGGRPSQMEQVDFDQVAQAIIGEYFGADSPLTAKIRNLSPYYADLMRDIVLEGVASGRGPLTIAQMITDNVLGASLSDAMRWTRTSQLYAYRWATLATYEQNGITQWIWQANLDASTCMSCIALHGKTFAISDGIANDHYNGRCYMVPFVPGYTDDRANPGAGMEWFENQPEAQQRAQMGGPKYEAWQDGKISLQDLTKFHDDDTFGTMRTETSLKELLPDG
jgi:SPP1 gp7 family putative phage head morphogenesis protein